MAKIALWKLYLWGRMNEYKLLGYIFADASTLPPVGRHGNICADIVANTDDKEHKFAIRTKPYPEERI